MKSPPPQNGASEALRPSWSTVNHFHQHISKTAGFWRREDFHGLSSDYIQQLHVSATVLIVYLNFILNTFLFRVSHYCIFMVQRLLSVIAPKSNLAFDTFVISKNPLPAQKGYDATTRSYEIPHPPKHLFIFKFERCRSFFCSKPKFESEKVRKLIFI